MNNLNLWEQLKKINEKCEWIDLSHEVSENTPHWHGFSSLKSSVLYDIEKDGYTSLNNESDMNLEETIRIAKTPWLDQFDDDDKK